MASNKEEIEAEEATTRQQEELNSFLDIENSGSQVRTPKATKVEAARQATSGANSPNEQSSPSQVISNGNGVYHMSNNFSEDLEVAQVNRGAIGDGAVGGLSTLSEEMSRSVVMEPNGYAKLVTSEPVDGGAELHSLASGAHQNARSAAFSDESQPTSINFNSSSEKKQQAKGGGQSDPSLIYIQEQNAQAATSNGGDDVRPKAVKRPSKQESSALSSGHFDEYGDSKPSRETIDVKAKQRGRANNPTQRQSKNGSALSSRGMLPPGEHQRARQT